MATSAEVEDPLAREVLESAAQAVRDSAVVREHAPDLCVISGAQDAEAAERLRAEKDCFVFDMDGVLWRSGQVIPRAVETVRALAAEGKKLVFITNNSTRSRQQYVQKLADLGFGQFDVGSVISSSFAAADYLAEHHPEVRKAFVIGDQGLVDELQGVGITVVGAQDEEFTTRVFEDFSACDDIPHEYEDAEIGSVVIGWDKSVNMCKLCCASYFVQRHNAVLLCTNRDAADAHLMYNVPGNGAIVAAVETATGQQATNVGKGGSPWLAQRTFERLGLDPARTVMVGDRLDSDILFAKTAPVEGGIHSLAVLSGISKPADIEQAARERAAVLARKEENPSSDGVHMCPDYVLPSIAYLYP